MREFVPVELFSAIDMVVMERQEDRSFRLKGTALDWFVRFCPEAATGEARLEPGKSFLFLDNFLIDAEEFWQTNHAGFLKSGLWIEPDASGRDCAFEAIAVALGEKKILLLKLCWMTYAEKQHIIQKGRELGLEYHRIRRLEEALERAQVELKERVKRRTAKLSKANELLRQEIEERKRVENALRESTETLKAILAASPVGIGLVRGGRTLEWVNKALCDLLEHEEGALAGKEATAFFSTREKWRAVVGEIVTGIGKAGIGWVETSLVTGSGRELTCMLQGSPLDASDLSRGIIVTALDLTERKRAEEDRIILERQLQHAQKMQAIGTLAGGIAHDFNNILGAIIGFAELAKTGITSHAKVERNLAGVLKASFRAKELVQQILTLARRSEQQLEPLELGPIIEEALRFLRASLPTTIEIRQEISPGSHTVNSNATQVHQVLMNLCTNAAHAMREQGGVIEVDLCDVELDSRDVLRMPDLKPGPHVKLGIRDNGHGIPPVVLERIFDPYFTTKAPGEGTGLGLAVVQGIVKSQGGGVSVCSEVSKGTLFQVFLPRIAGMDGFEEPVAEDLPRGNEGILFIDDDPTLVELGKESLEALGYRVVAKTSSVEALEVFRAQPEQFALVITDQTMPDMTGMVLARRLLEVCPGIPIILCTGYSEQVTKDGVAVSGIREVVMKPFVMRDLARSVRKILDGHI